MNNAGAFTFGDIGITTPGSYDGPIVDSLDGMSGYTVQAVLQPGPGSDPAAEVAVFIKTSIDQGERWIDSCVMRFCAGAGVGIQLITIQAKSTPDPVIPTDDAEDSRSPINDGILGDRLMASVVVTGGTLAGSSVVNVRGCVR